MHDGMKRTHHRKYCRRKYRNRETDRGKRGSMNCHLRRLRVDWGNPLENIKWLEDPAKNLAVPRTSYLRPQEALQALEQEGDHGELFYPQLKWNPLPIGAVHRTGI